MKYTISQFLTDYPDEATCLDELFQNRYGNQPFCVKCGVINPRYHRVKKRKCYACQDCGHQLYPLAGTIFEINEMNYSMTQKLDWIELNLTK